MGVIARNDLTTARVMVHVCAALVPGAIAMAVFLGTMALVNFAVAAAAAVVTEGLCLRSTRSLTDGSAVVTGLLIAFALPPSTPVLLTIFASAMAIAIGKLAYGGLGRNLFNPAMVGYAIVLVSFPQALSDWDAVSGATALDRMSHRFGATIAQTQADPAFGTFSAAGFEWVNVAIGLGGLYLIARRIVSWRVPCAFLLGMAIAAVAAFDSGGPASLGSPMFHWFAGGSMLAAFFVATDPVTSPSSAWGQWVFGFFVGAMTFAIRALGAYPDGIAFAVLLGNVVVPILERRRWARPA